MLIFPISLDVTPLSPYEIRLVGGFSHEFWSAAELYRNITFARIDTVRSWGTDKVKRELGNLFSSRKVGTIPKYQQICAYRVTGNECDFLNIIIIIFFRFFCQIQQDFLIKTFFSFQKMYK